MQSSDTVSTLSAESVDLVASRMSKEVLQNVEIGEEENGKGVLRNTVNVPETETETEIRIDHDRTMLAEPNYQDISLSREIGFMVLMCLSQLLTQAAVSQTMISADYIAPTFGVSGSPGEISWFSASFSLTVGTFILISGRLGDMYGYKLLYIVGYIWFAVFSLATGFAGFGSSSVLFNVMRALQGIGPAIMMPNSQALISSFYPNTFRKSICMCLFGAVAPSGFTLGAFFSAIFAQFSWWPWTFWVCGIVSFFVAICAYFVIPNKIGTRSSVSFDFYGSAAGVAGMVLINFAWNQGPVVGWDKPYVYSMLIVGIFCIIGFFFIEKKVKDPLISQEVLKGETGAVLCCIAAGWSTFGIWLFYYFRWSMLVDGDTPILSVTKSLVVIFPGFIAALSTGYLVHRIPSSFILLIAMLAFFTGIVLMGTRPVGQIYWSQKFVSLIIEPFGMDMSFPAACIILSGALPAAQQGMAGSLVSTFVNYSISIGLGIAGTVEYYVTKNMEPSLDTTVYGMRRAFQMGYGLAGLGVLIACSFVYIQLVQRRKEANQESVGKNSLG
ncbi:hypothetical protein G9P44_002991 [Scheffersomyces stipitis]|nr:hypothetical protein G9P44_002991 [Scheffersomyces stipitis]